MRKLRLDDTGVLLEDPRGLHATMPYQGRTLLGDIIDVRREEGIRRLVVRHFNGEPWPVDPLLLQVDVLVRS